MVGDYWAFEEFVTSSKMNNQIDNSQGNIAELAYKGQQVTGWENGGNIATEKYTVAEGLQDTVTIRSEAVPGNSESFSQAIGTSNVSSYTITGTVGTVVDKSYFAGIAFVANNTTNVTVSISKNTVQVASKTVFASGGSTSGVGFTVDDYSDFFEDGDTFAVTVTGLTENMRRSNSTTSFNGTLFSFSNQYVMGDNQTSNQMTMTEFTGYELKTDAQFSSDKYICKGIEGAYENTSIFHDKNTLAIDDETNGFCIHHQGDIPTDTAISYDLSDGTNTVNYPIDPTTKKSGVLSKGSLTNIDNVIITTNLSTTDATVTPTSEGFGITKL